MALVLANPRLTLISLLADDHSSIVPRLLNAPAFRGAAHIDLPFSAGASQDMLAARLDAAIAHADRAVMLVAQGAGCLAAACWARLSPAPPVSRIAGALLIAPDVTSGLTTARGALPFPSVVIGMDDATQRLAGEWGSRLIDGPITQRAPSGRFLSMIERFTAAIVERDVRAAERLLQAIGDG